MEKANEPRLSVRSVRSLVLGLLTVLLCFTPDICIASSSVSLDPVGLHTPLLKFEKNENPQNLMVVYTKLQPDNCAFEVAAAKTSGEATPVLDEYWLMDGKNYKRVHPMIKSSVSDRLEVDKEQFKSAKRFMVHLKDFSELKSDLGPSPTFEVKAKKVGKVCEASVEMKLGPSDKGRSVRIESIYADSSKQILPPFRKLNSLTINGKDLASGETVRRTYNAN